MENVNRIHPLVAAAAVSVIVVSATGVAALTGWLPKTSANAPAASAIAPESAATLAAPGGITAPVQPATKPAPKPAAKRAAPRPVQARAPEPVREFGEEEIERPLVLAQPAPQSAPQPAAQPAAAPKCHDCGVVQEVREVEQKGEGSWVGTVAGGVGGAILGSRFGNGSGRTIMTVLGAAGGAYAGREIEKHVRTAKRWDVAVRLEDGKVRTVSYPTQPAWRAGDRVRWVNGTLEALPQA